MVGMALWCWWGQRRVGTDGDDSGGGDERAVEKRHSSCDGDGIDGDDSVDGDDCGNGK